MRLHKDLTPLCAWLGMLLIAFASSASGQVTVLLDTFDRPDNDDIDLSNAGMSGIVAPFTYNEVGDTNTGLLGLTNIEGNDLSLADGTNMSVFHPEVNFVSSTTTSLSVSLDLVSNDGTADQAVQRFVGFGFGGTQAEAEGAGFDHNATAGNPGWKGHQNGTTAGSGFSDFFVAWERTGAAPDSAGQISVWKNGLQTSTLADPNDPNSTGIFTIGSTLEVDLSFADFNAGTTVSADVYYDGILLGTDSFTWDSTDSNYIGVAARQNGAGWSVDNLTVEANAFDFTPPELPSLTINRDTGNVTFTNPTNSTITLIGYSVQSPDAVFNSDPNVWNQLDDVDPNGGWIQFTAAGNPVSDLSEGTLGAGYDVDPNGSIDFGNVWIRSPFETISLAQFIDDLGADVPLTVSFEGNGGNAFGLGDFNFNGNLDPNDWAVLRSNLISDPNGAGVLTYGFGDMNLDGLINEDDFDEFKVAYNAANGGGSFELLLAGVPEPSSLALFALAGVIVSLRRPRVALALFMAVMICGVSVDQSFAQTNLFSDNFDRAVAQEDDIDASSTGMSGTLGALTYVENGDDLVPLATPTNTGLTNIANNELNLAFGNNASTFYIDHNFVDASITTDGVLSVSLDLTGNNGTNTDGNFFIGFGVGSTLAEHQAQTLLDFNAEPNAPAVRGRDDIDGLGFADLWVGWTPNAGGTIQIFKNGTIVQAIDDGITNATDPNSGATQPFDTLSSSSTLELRMQVNDFNVGGAVPATLYFNGTPVGGDAIRWDNANANYISIQSRQNEADPNNNIRGMAADNLAITTSTTSLDFQTLSLEVHTDTGEVFLVGAPADSTIDRYTISSASGLDPNAFNGIGGDDPNVPLGDGTGSGWELGGVQTTSLLNEFFLGSTGAGGSTLDSIYKSSLGFIYDTVADTQDLIVEYRLADGTIISGAATYGLAPIGTPGDFNSDGNVDGLDFLEWQRGFGTLYDAADLADWQTFYGTTSVSENSANVPEPSSLLMLLIGSGLAAGSRRHRKS